MSTMPRNNPTTTCTHNNVEFHEVFDESMSMYSMTLGGLAVYHTYVQCSDCGSMWTTDEFDRLCLDTYNTAAAESLHYEHGYLELYGHLTPIVAVAAK